MQQAAGLTHTGTPRGIADVENFLRPLDRPQQTVPQSRTASYRDRTLGRSAPSSSGHISCRSLQRPKMVKAKYWTVVAAYDGAPKPTDYKVSMWLGKVFAETRTSSCLHQRCSLRSAFKGQLERKVSSMPTSVFQTSPPLPDRGGGDPRAGGWPVPGGGAGVERGPVHAGLRRLRPRPGRHEATLPPVRLPGDEDSNSVFDQI